MFGKCFDFDWKCWKTLFSKIHLIKYSKNYSYFWLKICESTKNASEYVIKFSVRSSNKKNVFFDGFSTIFLQFSLIFGNFWDGHGFRYFFLLNLPIISVVSTEFSGFRWFFREFSIYGVFSNFCLFVFRFVFSQNPVEIGQNSYFLQN